MRELMAGQAGVLTGDNVRKLFEYAKEHQVRFPFE